MLKIPPDPITVREAAEILNLSPRRVQQYASAGRIKGAVRLGRQWIFPRQMMIDYFDFGPLPRWYPEDPDDDEEVGPEMKYRQSVLS